jgi:uncharacterized protein
MKRLESKLSRLRTVVGSLGGAAVAFSGGTDSTLVAKIAADELGDRAVAVTVTSPLYPKSELRNARAVAKKIGIRHVVIELDPLQERRFASNPRNRCYLCKRGDMKAIWRVAHENGLLAVMDGTNADDRLDYRPGSKAKQELGVRSPLAEAGLTKSEVRGISELLELPTSKKSSSPCLASRVPYGEKITRLKLERIEKAEDFLRSKGFENVRVRAHGNIARVEVDRRSIPELTSGKASKAIANKLRSLGFSYVTVDLEGYRAGSMNEVLRR